MASDLSEEIKKAIQEFQQTDPDTHQRFLDRIEQENPTRDENPESHFCAYFLPYNKAEQTVFYGHHKKSGLWLSPGGHIDAGESLLECLNREISEELGVQNFFKQNQTPFCISITPIANEKILCQHHYDLWYLMETDGNNFEVDLTEFYQANWLSIQKALDTTKDPSNIKALKIL